MSQSNEIYDKIVEKINQLDKTWQNMSPDDVVKAQTRKITLTKFQDELRKSYPELS